jgi:hypothetical protein
VLALQLALYSGSAKAVGVSADVLTASSTVKCSNGSSSVDPDTTGASLANVTVEAGGQTINVPANPPPNTTVPIGPVDDVISGALVLNEQYDDGGRHVVNALHLTVQLAGGNNVDLIISHAEAGITCGSGGNACTCPVKDFVTGGGWIILPGGAKGTFGMVGGVKANGLQGHFNYIDHDNGTHIQGTALQSYTGDPPSTERDLVYTCTQDDTSVDGGCDVRVSDNGEPGGGVDRFSLTSNSYSADGPYLEKGNIQLHHPDCGGKQHGRK